MYTMNIQNISKHRKAGIIMADKTKTPLQEVQEQMEAITNRKGQELAQIEGKLAQAQEEVDKAATDMQEATENMNVDAYEEATARQRKAKTACEMYQACKKQLEHPEHFITEKESDKAIGALLGYEQTLAAEFKAKFADALQILDGILFEYDSAVDDVERTIAEWTTRVHANHISSTTMWPDPETGKMTSRSKNPVPVHATAYTGCQEANSLREFIRKAKDVCKK